MGFTRRGGLAQVGPFRSPFGGPPKPNDEPAAAWVEFAREFMRNPREVGSVLPSSPALARAVVDAIPRRARAIAEFGPGTGAITRELLARFGRNVRVVAFEIDPRFCEVLTASIPDPRLVVINRPAEDLTQVADEMGITFDAVVSSLPLVNFPPPLRNVILHATRAGLPNGGVVAGYTYTPYVVPRLMRETFGNCALRFVWRNVPPAFVFRSIR